MGIFDIFKKKKQDKVIEDTQFSIELVPTKQEVYSGYNNYIPENRNYYVYIWYIKESKEVFYVGRGRNHEYDATHDRLPDFAKIRELYQTDIRYLAEGLTEEESINLRDDVMLEILNESEDILVNRTTPLFARRSDGYGESKNTPPYQFEVTPVFFASEIEEHYFGMQSIPFDKVKFENLNGIYISQRVIINEKELYGGNSIKYVAELIELAQLLGLKILKSRYAKSVKSWVYLDSDYASNHIVDIQNMHERLGREVPTYHLFDVLTVLREKVANKSKNYISEKIEINPKHNRISFDSIKHIPFEEGFDKGFPFFEKAEELAKQKKFEEALVFMDQARESGYFLPALYERYAKIFRSLKDYDNEIEILEECLRTQNVSPQLAQRLMRAKELKRK